MSYGPGFRCGTIPRDKRVEVGLAARGSQAQAARFNGDDGDPTPQHALARIK